MRALRFSSVLDFDIDKDTVTSIHSNRHLLHNISRERIYSEFRKMLCGNNAYKIFSDYFDVLCEIFSNLNLYETQFKKNISVIPDTIADFTIRAVILFNNIEIEFVKSLIKSLKSDKKTYNDIISLCEYVVRDIPVNDISVKRIMNRFNHELIIKFAAIKKALDPDFDDAAFLDIYNNLLKKDVCVSIKQLDIDGCDLKENGIDNGPMIGDILNFLLDAVIEERCNNTKNELIKYLKSYEFID